jgi:sialate O-acetylesterase
MKFSRRETSVILVPVSCLALLINGQIAGAELTLGRPFSDHMVVQRNMELAVWGKAASGKSVEVRIGSETRMTVAGGNGSWRVAFPAREASIRSFVIEIESADELLTVRDVLCGEVWLCAGQSNMEWPVSASASANEALAGADNPQIRLLNYQGAARGGSGRYTAEHLAKLTAERFCKGTWNLCSAETVSPFSAVGYYFGLALQRELGVPIGLINVSIGGTPAEAWVRREALATHPQLKALVQGNWLENGHLGAWCRERAAFNLGRATVEGEEIPGDELGPNHSFKPGFMWESAVAPMIPLPIRGVIWYQGESNAQLDWRVSQHRAIFELLVADWRKQFGLGEFPFLFVQLPGMGRPHWPEFREQQRRALKCLPNTGMAITIDIGHPTNVHPKTKKPVGERLARWALAKTYRRKNIVASGPLYRSMRVDGRHIELEFDHAGSGLQPRDGLPLRHFEIAGADGKFHPAQANIVSGRVVVTCGAVELPKHVRYGWVMFPNPPVNFYNRESLPASPFNTLEDDLWQRTMTRG